MSTYSKKLSEYFDSLMIIYVDTDQSTSRTIRQGLQQAGLKNIIAITSGDELRGSLKNANLHADLIMLDYNCLKEDTIDLIRDIRHHRYACNPFVPMVGVTGELTKSFIMSFARSGIDDVISRPFSIATILQRISNYAHGRKPYIATADYIGPDRRTKEERKNDDKTRLNEQNKDTARAINLRSISVPNPLKMKAEKNYSIVEVNAKTQEALHALMIEALQGSVFQLMFHSIILCEPIAKKLNVENLKSHLQAMHTNLERVFTYMKSLETQMNDVKTITGDMRQQIDALCHFVNTQFPSDSIAGQESFDHALFHEMLNIAHELTISTYQKSQPHKAIVEVKDSAKKYIKRFYS